MILFAGGADLGAQPPFVYFYSKLVTFSRKGCPIGLPLRACNEHRPHYLNFDDHACALREHRRPSGNPSLTYTGRGAKPAGLVSDRTRYLFSLEFFQSLLEFLPISLPSISSPITSS